MKKGIKQKESTKGLIVIPYGELRKLIGVPKGALVTYIYSSKSIGLYVEYLK